MRREVAVGLLAAASLTPWGLSAQRTADRVVVRGEPSCGTCRIRLTRVARLGADPDGYIVGEFALVFKDSRDRWLVFGAENEFQAKVYRFDGSFLQSFGRKGQGPGEFSIAVGLQEFPKDTLNLWDFGNSRISRFTLDFDYLDQTRLSLPPQSLLYTTEGTLVQNALHLVPSRETLPLHLIGPNGTVAGSFGTIQAPYSRSGRGNEYIRRIAPGSGGGLWEGALARYELRHWSSTGELIRVVERDAAWFEPHSDPSIRGSPRDSPPRPRLEGVREDAGGHLWTLVHLPEGDWETGFHPKVMKSGLVVDQPVLGEQYDTRIEVLDPREGVPLASITVPEAVRAFVGAGPGEIYFWTVLRGPTGEILLDIWLARLVGSAP